MKILVTGGAGYKGTVLTKKLLDKGFKVTVLDNFMYGYEPIIHLVKHQNLTVIKHDIRNRFDKISDFDIIIHLAGISGFPACAANQHSAQLINVEATRLLHDSVSNNQILINASTTSMYGRSGEACDENTPVDPVSTYAITKMEAEKILMGKPNAISLRFATVFGVSPRMRMDLMINDFTYKAVKEGIVVLFDSFAKRTFIHIEDAADCYLFTLDHFNEMRGGIYNAGGNNLNFSKDEITDKIRKHVEFNVINSEFSDKDLRHFIVNFDKIEKIGYKPKITIDDGILELLKFYRFYEYYSHFKTI